MLEEFPVHQFGSTTMAKVSSSDQLKRLLIDPVFDSETIIIKPNWISTDPAEFTDAESMRMVFQALDSRIVVVESYCIARSLNLMKKGRSFLAGDRMVDWKWLLKGKGWNWLLENPDWDWFKREGHWDQIREEDKAFRDHNGFSDLFREFDVTYVNVTEEVWSGRIADPSAIQQSVESRFKPVQCPDLYAMVPRKLHDLRGSTFISLAKFKLYASFTFKNLFGLIPDPLRARWHGPDNSRIAASIVDINKIYHSLFRVYGICEAFRTMSFADPAGKHKNLFSGRYNIADGHGVVAVGKDVLSLDAILLRLSDPSRRNIEEESMHAPLELAAEEFGAIDRSSVEEAALKVEGWV